MLEIQQGYQDGKEYANFVMRNPIPNAYDMEELIANLFLNHITGQSLGIQSSQYEQGKLYSMRKAVVGWINHN